MGASAQRAQELVDPGLTSVGPYPVWVRVIVKVKPCSGRRDVVTEQDGSLLVYLKAAPENGKANAELIASLARHFNVTQSEIRIIRGATSRSKVVDVGLR